MYYSITEENEARIKAERALTMHNLLDRLWGLALIVAAILLAAWIFG